MSKNTEGAKAAITEMIDDVENRVLPNINNDVDTKAIIGMVVEAMDSFMQTLNGVPIRTSTLMEVQFIRSVISTMFTTDTVTIDNPPEFYTKVMHENLRTLKRMLDAVGGKEDECLHCPDKLKCDKEHTEEKQKQRSTTWDPSTVH